MHDRAGSADPESSGSVPGAGMTRTRLIGWPPSCQAERDHIQTAMIHFAGCNGWDHFDFLWTWRRGRLNMSLGGIGPMRERAMSV